MGAIRTQSEREAAEKKKLEDSVMEKMMQRLTMDKASQYTRKAVDTVRKRTDVLVSHGQSSGAHYGHKELSIEHTVTCMMHRNLQ